MIVVVTGGSAGVGRAIVREFAKRGCDLAILARGSEGLEGARREVEAEGRRCLALSVDVSDPLAVDAAASRVEAALGPIDVWVNNAMVSVFAPFLQVEPEEFRRVTDVTYHGFVWGTRAALRRMRARNRGTIVMVGSALAYRGIPLQAGYCGAKHAIVGFFESVRAELLHEGSAVRMTMVQLPGMNTPQFRWTRTRLPRKSQPVPPIYQPEVAARAVVHAALQGRRREYLVGGSTVQAVVGGKLAPAVADHMVARQAWEGQMTDEPDPHDRPDNLFSPVPGDAGAHGVFDGRAKSWSAQSTLNLNRRWLGLAAGLLLGGLSAFALRRRPPRPAPPPAREWPRRVEVVSGVGSRESVVSSQ